MDTEAEEEHRRETQGKELRGHWKQRGWEPFQPDGFYVTWPGLAQYAWRLLVCNLVGHRWYDVHFILHGEPGDARTCDRCWRDEALEEA